LRFAQAAAAKEEAMARADLLRTRTVLTPPSVLTEAGVPVFKLVQPKSSFVVVWPGAHVAGFSTGFNISETTTLAPPDWLPYVPHTLSLSHTHTRGVCEIASNRPPDVP
jgi:hypothetical protein